ncbi:ATP-binding protein [Coprothermobacter platensis]|uniref:ATP-binding protein n=1 Tax=Coprothermobacter platensis TaxID=108819 RepID=UPI00036E6A24|nr:ATP-binding protein [Coprothermobacter platensis]
MEANNPVGIVSGLEKNTPTEFFVNLFSEDGQSIKVRIGDVIRVSVFYNGQEVTYYGTVYDIVSRWDSDVDSGFKEKAVFEKLVPGTRFYVAAVAVTRACYSAQEVFDEPLSVPAPGTPAFLVTEKEEVEKALRFDELKKRGSHLPVGVMINGQPAYVDLGFILGENGAHINISGQSGVAAKTSYATFLMAAMIQRGRDTGRYANALRQGRYIVFNMKGESLFFLDCDSEDWLKADAHDREMWMTMYESMGLDPEWKFPLDNIVYLGVAEGLGGAKLKKPDIKSRTKAEGHLRVYGWDFIDIIRYRLLELALDEEEMSLSQNMQLLLFSIQEKMEELLEQLAMDVERVFNERNSGVNTAFYKDEEKLNAEDTEENSDEDSEDVLELLRKAKSNIKCSVPEDPYERLRLVLYASNVEPRKILQKYGIPETVDDLTNYLRKAALGEKADVKADEMHAVEEWRKAIFENELGTATVFAFVRRLKLARKEGLSKLWRELPYGLSGDVENLPDEEFEYNVGRSWDRSGGITVIDLSKLHSSMQTFVVGAVLRQVMEAKMANPLATEQPVFIFLDELNKYAPRAEGGAMVKLFRDVAERGRSFGVVLVGAEQTASQVDFRVVTQSSTTIVGHQKAAELNHDEYKHLLDRQREMASSVGPGVVFIDQPFLRVPIMVKFPMTRWSTKETKVSNEGGRLKRILG